MSAASTAYITCGTGGGARTWHFTGVTSVEHTLALNLGSTAAKRIARRMRKPSSRKRVSAAPTARMRPAFTSALPSKGSAKPRTGL